MPPGGYSLRATWFRSNLSRLLQLSCYPNHLGTDTERGEAELRRHTCNLDIGGIRPRAAIASFSSSSLLGSTAMLDNRRGSAFERLSSCAGQRTPVRMHCSEGIRGMDWCFFYSQPSSDLLQRTIKSASVLHDAYRVTWTNFYFFSPTTVLVKLASLSRGGADFHGSETFGSCGFKALSIRVHLFIQSTLQYQAPSMK